MAEVAPLCRHKKCLQTAVAQFLLSYPSFSVYIRIDFFTPHAFRPAVMVGMVTSRSLRTVSASGPRSLPVFITQHPGCRGLRLDIRPALFGFSTKCSRIGFRYDISGSVFPTVKYYGSIPDG